MSYLFQRILLFPELWRVLCGGKGKQTSGVRGERRGEGGGWVSRAPGWGQVKETKSQDKLPVTEVLRTVILAGRERGSHRELEDPA